jgi:hypothetical protein
MGRYNSWIGVLLFAGAFVAAAIATIWWSILLIRTARNLRRVGNTSRAELLKLIARRSLLWSAGTVLFTAVFWLAVCHDLNDRGERAVRLLPSGPLLP